MNPPRTSLSDFSSHLHGSFFKNNKPKSNRPCKSVGNVCWLQPSYLMSGQWSQIYDLMILSFPLTPQTPAWPRKLHVQNVIVRSFNQVGILKRHSARVMTSHVKSKTCKCLSEMFGMDDRFVLIMFTFFCRF